MSNTEFFSKGNKIAIVTDGSDKGILRVASVVIKDIERVSKSERKFCRIAVTDDVASGKIAYADTLVFAGILKDSGSLISRLLAKTTVSPSEVIGKKEVYAFASVEAFPGLEQSFYEFVCDIFSREDHPVDDPDISRRDRPDLQDLDQFQLGQA